MDCVKADINDAMHLFVSSIKLWPNDEFSHSSVTAATCFIGQTTVQFYNDVKTSVSRFEVMRNPISKSESVNQMENPS